MTVIYTDHFLQRSKQRNVPLNLIYNLIKHVNLPQHKKVYIKNIKHELTVVLKSRNKSIVAITVITGLNNIRYAKNSLVITI